VATLNGSKFFAGLMIITLNIASKFVTFKLSKTMEAYLKFTFSRLILVFAIAWVGTRDIYTALVICLLFTICMDFLFNEESRFCCLPSTFTDYHVGLLEGMDTQSGMNLSKIDEAIQVLEQVKKQQQQSPSHALFARPRRVNRRVHAPHGLDRDVHRKITSVQSEYEQLLESQLEAQRLFFEKLLGFCIQH
jgi:hypothetical protein